MKIKTSITISDYLIDEIDSIEHDSKNRSRFIEEAVISYLETKKKLSRDKKDLELINKNEKFLNKEAADILSYQVKI